MRKAFAFVAALAVALATAVLPASARAQATIAPDLAAALASADIPAVPWLANVNGQKLVKVLVAARSDDATLADLRDTVVSLGGSVFYNYASLRMIAVTLPASAVPALAQRADVVSISPNRAVTRTASTLQLTTGAANASVPGAGKLDGSGVGIAIVDSGIGYSHQSLSTTTLLGLKGRRACSRRSTGCRSEETWARPGGSSASTPRARSRPC
jgi:hypothetical protein